MESVTCAAGESAARGKEVIRDGVRLRVIDMTCTAAALALIHAQEPFMLPGS